MSNRRRLWTTLLVGSAILAVMVLAAGLTGIDLKPGQPFHSLAPRRSVSPAEISASDEGLLTALRVLIAATFILTPIAMIIAIIHPEARKKVIQRAIWLFFVAGALFVIMRQMGDIYQSLTEVSKASQNAAQALPPTVIAAPAFITSPPQWVTIAITSVVILVALIIAYVFWHSSRPGEGRQLQALAFEAREAVQEIQQGADLKDVVMRCYAEMSRILSEERGLKRGVAMTPREFEERLREAGLPPAPIGRLTRLFESVRYGTQSPDEAEQEEAVHCLTAIAEACAAVPQMQ